MARQRPPCRHRLATLPLRLPRLLRLPLPPLLPLRLPRLLTP
jgi:hypothetical protein